MFEPDDQWSLRQSFMERNKERTLSNKILLRISNMLELLVIMAFSGKE
jgi:hypothetical protein